MAGALRPGGRFVLGDVVVPADASSPVISLTDGYDKPSTVDEQLGWRPRRVWTPVPSPDSA